MHNLDLAICQIVKIQDLVVRLLHEGFSGRLIDVDYDEEGWEKELRTISDSDVRQKLNDLDSKISGEQEWIRVFRKTKSS